MSAAARAGFRLEVRRSVFAAEAARAADAEAARAFARSVAARRRHAGAGHHCWGFAAAGAADRCDDDGEPAGTAGRPIVAAIRSRPAALRRGTVVVVARWKRGPNLGRGGLVRAYREAALGALDELDELDGGDDGEDGDDGRGDDDGDGEGDAREEKPQARRGNVAVPFENAHKIFAALKTVGGDTLEQAVEEEAAAEGLTTIVVQVPTSAADMLETKLRDVEGAVLRWDA